MTGGYPERFKFQAYFTLDSAQMIHRSLIYLYVQYKTMDKLLERSPGEYFRVEEGTEELVLTSVWKSLLSAGLVDSHHEAILLDQIFDLFDVSVLHGIQSLVVDV